MEEKKNTLEEKAELYSKTISKNDTYQKYLKAAFIAGHKEAVNHHEELVEALEEASELIGKLKRTISVHPDCEEGSEFDDYTDSAQEMENDIKELLSKLK